MIVFLTLLADTKKVNRKNITGCYDESTSVKINLNTYTLTLYLNPTNKSECYDIEPAAFVNLTLHANGYLCDNITLLLQDFYYKNTTTIEFNFYKTKMNIVNINDVFCDPNIAADQYLQKMPEITFGFIQIYTHSHLLTTQMMQYSQTKTNIKGCFSSISAQMTDNYQILLTTVPTLVCKNLINKKTQTQTDNIISEIELIFNDISFILPKADMNTIIDAYNAQQESTVTVTGIDKVKQLAESDRNTGQMKVTSIQNGVPVYILYNLNFSQNSQREFFSYATFSGGKDMMFFQFEENITAVNEINSDTTKAFSYYKLKLIINQGNDYITYQKYITSNQFDPHDNIWIIECSNMTGFQRENCQNYSAYIRNSENVEVQLYVAFYDKENNFIFHEQTTMTQYISCIQELEVRYINNSFVKTDYILYDIKLCHKYQNHTINSASLFIADGTYKGDLQDLYLYNRSVKGLFSVNFHCEEGQSCNLNNNYIQLAQKNYVVLEIELLNSKQESVIFSTITNKLSLQNDNIVSYPALVMGGITLLSCLIMTLYNLVMIMKRVKLIKKKKLKL